MKYFYNIEEIVFDCLKYVDKTLGHVVIICNYEMAIGLVNEVVKYTDFVLKEFENGSNCEGPFIVDMYSDNELWVLSALNGSGKYLAPDCDHIFIAGDFAAGFKAQWPDVDFTEFRMGEPEETDYCICMNADEKGFCFCRNLSDGHSYQLVYKGNEKLTERDAYNIVSDYGYLED